MNNVIKELYHGNLGFDSWNYGKDSPFVKAAQKKSDNMKALMETFDDSQKELFEGYLDARVILKPLPDMTHLWRRLDLVFCLWLQFTQMMVAVSENIFWVRKHNRSKNDHYCDRFHIDEIPLEFI